MIDEVIRAKVSEIEQDHLITKEQDLKTNRIVNDVKKIKVIIVKFFILYRYFIQGI
jgi:hypothetical protein